MLVDFLTRFRERRTKKLHNRAQSCLFTMKIKFQNLCIYFGMCNALNSGFLSPLGLTMLNNNNPPTIYKGGFFVRI